MENPPREVLRVPKRMPPIPSKFAFMSREEIGLLTEGEEALGDHLNHSVSFHSCKVAKHVCQKLRAQQVFVTASARVCFHVSKCSKAWMQPLKVRLAAHLLLAHLSVVSQSWPHLTFKAASETSTILSPKMTIDLLSVLRCWGCCTEMPHALK